jgi:iron complex outermembrane recepter protein
LQSAVSLNRESQQSRANKTNSLTKGDFMPKYFAYKRSAVAVATALGVGTVLGIASQQAAAQEAARVVVTGSQIPRVDAETPSPVQVITSEQIRNSGFTTISDVLQSITANGQGTLSQGFGRAFAGGSSGVSLRGLTVGSTLVLIDGHRMAPYPLSDDGQRPFVDISNIPFEAVDRIEILKDGASAVYGSDAMAGVVNVILKKSFVGTSMTADFGDSQHGGGKTKHLSVIHGFGNAASGDSGYFAIEYRHQEPVMLSQRSGNWTNLNYTAQGGMDNRPGAVNAIVPVPRFQFPYLQVPGSSVASGPGSFAFLPGSGCSYASFTTGCTFTNTWAQIQPGSENVNLLASSTTRLSNDWQLNIKASLFDSKSQQTGAPSVIPLSSFAGVTAYGPNLPVRIIGALPAGTFQVPATYPGNPFGVAANIRGTLPLSDWPNGFSEDFDTKSTRLVAELEGSLAGWDLKGSAGYTKVQTDIRYGGLINFNGLAAALADPVDPFLLGGGNDPFNLNRVSPVVNSSVSDVLKFVEVRGNRELMKLQGGPLSLGVGLSYVTKDLNNPNPTERQLGLMAVPGAYAIGSDNDKSAYAELVAPVLKTLELDGAVRYDDYNTYGSTTTPKVGFKFTPIKQFGIRGTASRGFRAPAATENGVSGSLFGFNQIVDPVLCPTPPILRPQPTSVDSVRSR